MKEKVLAAMDFLYLACIWVSGCSLFIMTIVIPIGVFNRYILGRGSMWPEPLAILCMIIFTFVGAAATYRAGGHIAVSMLTDRVPENARGVLSWGVKVLMAVLAIFVAKYGISLCQVTWDQYIAELPVLRVGITYLPLPIGSLITLVFIAEDMFFGSQQKRPVVQIGSHGANNAPSQPTGEK